MPYKGVLIVGSIVKGLEVQAEAGFVLRGGKPSPVFQVRCLAHGHINTIPPSKARNEGCPTCRNNGNGPTKQKTDGNERLWDAARKEHQKRVARLIAGGWTQQEALQDAPTVKELYNEFRASTVLKLDENGHLVEEPQPDDYDRHADLRTVTRFRQYDAPRDTKI